MANPAATPENTIVMVPARMGSTRLPGKPLADIAGQPMIVQVMRRAREAELGRVVVAADDAAILEAVVAAGGEAVLTDPAHPSGSDRIREALIHVDPHGEAQFIVNVQGDLPTIPGEVIRACLKPLKTGPADISTLAAEIRDEEEKANPNVVKLIGSPPRPGARDRFTITLVSMPIAAMHWSVSFRCPPRRSKSGSGWNSCARWRPACASTPFALTPCRSAWIHRPIWRRPARCSADRRRKRARSSFVSSGTVA